MRRLRRLSSAGQSRNRWITWALVVVALFVVIRVAATCAGARHPVDGAVGVAAGAAASGTGAVVGGAASILEAFRIGRHLHRERTLEGEVALLNTQLLEAQAMQSENGRLRALLGLPRYTTFNCVSAEVVTRSMDFWFDTLVLNRGSESGIAVQNLVVNGDGLVGEVAEAGRGYAKVRLLTSPDFALSAVSNVSGVGGVVKGGGTVGLSFEYVPAESPLKLQEKLFTAGLAMQADGGRRPRGILLGHIESIKKAPNLTTLRVTVRPAVNISDIGPVIVLVPK
jgi:rod shape-determining protein MreC